MIKYGKILKMQEKDNPSPFCRASYLISNVGDMIKCYGRMLRFPDDAHIYKKEMELAMGDVIMQCRLIQVENNIKENEPNWYDPINIDTHLAFILGASSNLFDIMSDTRGIIRIQPGTEEKWETETILQHMNRLCMLMNLNFEEIQHLGFIHTIERFKEFERSGWQ